MGGQGREISPLMHMLVKEGITPLVRVEDERLAQSACDAIMVIRRVSLKRLQSVSQERSEGTQRRKKLGDEVLCVRPHLLDGLSRWCV